MKARRHAPRFLRKKPHAISLLGKYQQAIHLAKELKHKEKELHSLRIDQLKKFSVKKIQKLNAQKEKSIQKHPEKTDYYGRKYDVIIRSYAKDFVHEVEKLIDLYTNIFSDLDKIVEFDDRSEYQEILSVEEILHEIVQYRGQYAFLDDDIKRANAALSSVEKMLKKDAVRAYKNDERELHHHKPKKMGRMRMHKSDVKLSKMLLKADKELAGNEDVWKATAKRIKKQLQQGTKPDFPLLLEGFVEEFALVERVIKIIRQDVRALVIHHVQEHNKDQARMHEYVSLIENEFKNIHISKDLQKKVEAFYYGQDEEDPVGEKAIAFANEDARAEKSIYYQVKKEESMHNMVIKRFEHDRHKIKKETERLAA